MTKKDESGLNGFTTIRIKNSTLRRLKYNYFYSDSISEKIDYLITYWEAAAEHYHRRTLTNLIHIIEDFNNEQPLNGFDDTLKRLESLFADEKITYVSAKMPIELPSGYPGQKLYITIYREDPHISKDMRRHPFALLVISPHETFKFYIPFEEKNLTGIWTLKQAEQEIEIPTWIEEKLVTETSKGKEITISVEEAYQRVIPG